MQLKQNDFLALSFVKILVMLSLRLRVGDECRFRAAYDAVDVTVSLVTKVISIVTAKVVDISRFCHIVVPVAPHNRAFVRNIAGWASHGRCKTYK